MEFEGVVASQLATLGYPIFYRNFEIFYNRTQLSEFDIVSDGFIVEVKSGRDYKTKGLNFMYIQGMLPVGYKYYIYCPMLSDDEIGCLNEYFERGPILYINSYAKIIENHRPCRDCVLVSESLFANFLNLPMAVINTFGKLYIKKADFDKMVHRVHNERDRYSFNDNMRWSDKIDYLLRVDRLIVTSSPPPPHIPLMVREERTNRSIKLLRLEPFPIRRVYYINLMPKDTSMVDICL